MIPNINDIEAWESGTMEAEAEVVFFQGLINSGVVWQLQGCYGRQAERLIEVGYCTPPSGG